MATIQEVYIALFGRPADPVGYNFYVDATDDGANLDAVGDLTGSDEYLSRFEGQNDVQMINQIFQDLFGRDADAQGLLFYVQLLQSGQASMQDIAIRILDGATGTDQDIIDAKVAAADAFTASLDEGSEIVAYSGDAGIAFGQQFLSQIQSGDDELTQEEIDAQIADFVINGPQTIGNIYTLTAGVDEVEGSANNDTFRAVTTNALDSTDILDGGAGNDVLNINAAFAAGSAPVINSIETINNNVGGTLNLEAVTGATRINSAASSTYTNASLATVFAATAGATTVTVGYAGDLSGEADAANVAADLAATGTVDFTFTNAADIESVNLSVDATDAATGVTTVDLDDNLTALETVTITGAGNVILDTLAGATLETVDASASTGDVTISLAAAANSDADAEDLSIATGAGDDTVTLAGQADATVSLGAGDDVVNLLGTEGGASITLGAGFDTVAFTAVANIADADEADFAADIISVTDFNGAQDEIDLSSLTTAFDEVTLTNSQRNDVEGADNLFDALTEAGTLTGVAGEGVVFEFNNNTYIYIDNDGNGFDAGDGVIELVGFTGDLNGTNLIIA